jgi:hypothetical protein
VVYGLRTQAMFAHIAGALGNCTLIKEEDAGTTWSAEPDVGVPDLRIVTREGRELLVEVKNHRPDDAVAPYRLRSDYLRGLRRYADLMTRPLFVAIYWSKPHLWSLTPLEKLLATDASQLEFEAAMKSSEMRLLGDFMVGTESPLEFRFVTDATKPRTATDRGDGTIEAMFTIARAEIRSSGRVITDPLERRIAFFLMSYGNWKCSDPTMETVEGEVQSVGLTVEPEERDEPEQGFQMIGLMSAMLSRQYDENTVKDGAVELLAPRREPDQLGVIIPHDYRGKALRLWRFVVAPS